MDLVWLAPLLASFGALAVLLTLGAALETSRRRLERERTALVVVASSARSLAAEARAAHGAR